MKLETTQLAKGRVTIVPDAVESKHLTIVVEKLLERVQTLVGTERILRAVLNVTQMLVRIVGCAERIAHAHAQLGEEVARERIAPGDLVPTTVELDLFLHVEIFDRVERVVVRSRSRYAMTRYDCALIVAGVFRARLVHLNRVVF